MSWCDTEGERETKKERVKREGSRWIDGERVPLWAYSHGPFLRASHGQSVGHTRMAGELSERAVIIGAFMLGPSLK